MPADMYISRTISLNGDLAASAAPQQGMAAPNLHSLMAIIRADLPCKHACGPIAASHGPDNNTAVNAGVLLGSQLKCPFLAGQPRTRACFWCLGGGNLVACNHCPRCFCYNCYKQRHSYGIINWAKVLKESNFYCSVCTGKEPASNEGGEL